VIMMAPRVETKVTASSLAAALSGVVLWVLQTYVFKGNNVPAGAVTLVDVGIPAVCAWMAGYLAPHTPRPAAPAAPPAAPAPTALPPSH
jgi:hypothetical protein